jgi:hypothetical protein
VLSESERLVGPASSQNSDRERVFTAHTGGGRAHTHTRTHTQARRHTHLMLARAPALAGRAGLRRWRAVAERGASAAAAAPRVAGAFLFFFCCGHNAPRGVYRKPLPFLRQPCTHPSRLRRRWRGGVDRTVARPASPNAGARATRAARSLFSRILLHQKKHTHNSRHPARPPPGHPPPRRRGVRICGRAVRAAESEAGR